MLTTRAILCVSALAAFAGFGGAASADCESPDLIDYSTGGRYGPGDVYLAHGEVRVVSGTLRLVPGTIVHACGDDSVLVITTGAKIDARGTVFQPASPSGYWRGLYLLGKAPTTAAIEPAWGLSEDPLNYFGGYRHGHNCGLLQDVRITHAGMSTTVEPDPPNTEAAVFVAACGRATRFNHVVVDDSQDDGIEFIGGGFTINRAVVSGAGDDGIDWDGGFHGYFFNPSVMDVSDDRPGSTLAFAYETSDGSAFYCRPFAGDAEAPMRVGKNAAVRIANGNLDPSEFDIKDSGQLEFVDKCWHGHGK